MLLFMLLLLLFALPAYSVSYVEKKNFHPQQKRETYGMAQSFQHMPLLSITQISLLSCWAAKRCCRTEVRQQKTQTLSWAVFFSFLYFPRFIEK